MAALSFGMFLLFQLISLTQKDVVLESVEPTVEGYEEMDIISPEATSQNSSEMQSPTEMQNEDEQKHQHYVPTIPNEMDVDEPITATTKNKPVATTRREEDVLHRRILRLRLLPMWHRIAKAELPKESCPHWRSLRGRIMLMS